MARRRGVPAPCPCGSGDAYAGCCGPVHDGRAARTPEELVRSRYSAHALGRVGHLLDTWQAGTRPGRLVLEDGLRWTGLHVLQAGGGSLLESTGTVEFRAAWTRGGERGVLHERSRFVREAGRWLYVGPVAGPTGEAAGRPTQASGGRPPVTGAGGPPGTAAGGRR